MRALPVIVAVAVAAAPAAAQDMGLRATGGCASVPMLRAAVPVVEVTIGGKGPYRFVIDTGAPGHGKISAELAATLGLPKVGDAGMPARPLFGAPEVSVGKVSFKNVDLEALPSGRDGETELDGVLGNALIQLLPLTLDYGSGRARFGGPGLEEGLVIGFDQGVPVLPIDIAGKRLRLRFDSGSEAAALILEQEAATALPLAGEPVESSGARTGLGDSGIMEAPLAVSVTAGGVPLPIEAVRWPGERAGGTLGSRAMAGMSVTIDAASQLARVERSGRSPTCPG